MLNDTILIGFIRSLEPVWYCKKQYALIKVSTKNYDKPTAQNLIQCLISLDFNLHFWKSKIYQDLATAIEKGFEIGLQGWLLECDLTQENEISVLKSDDIFLNDRIYVIASHFKIFDKGGNNGK